MDVFKRLIDIEDDGSNVDASQLSGLGQQELVKKCKQLIKENEDSKKGYVDILEETQLLRKEYDSYKLKARAKETEMEAALQEEQRKTQEGAQVSASERAEELETQLTTLNGAHKVSLQTISALEERVAQADTARLRTEDEKTKELSTCAKTMEAWKQRMTEERDSLKSEIGALRGQIVNMQSASERATVAANKADGESTGESGEVLERETREMRENLKAQTETNNSLLDQLQSSKNKASKDLEDANWEVMQAMSKLNEAKINSEQLQTQLATSETRGKRLEAELEEKEREMRELLRKQEANFKTARGTLEATIAKLKEDIDNTHKKMTDMGNHAAMSTEIIGSKQMHLQDQLDSTQQKLKETLDKYDEVSMGAKVQADRLAQVEADLAETKTELHHRDRALQSITREYEEAQQRLISLEEQTIDAQHVLQQREDEIEGNVRERLLLLEKVTEGTAALRVIENDKQTLKASLSELQAELREKDTVEAGLKKDVLDLQSQMQSQLETSTNIESLQTLKEDEVAGLRQRLEERENRIEDLQRLKDESSARVRQLEKVVREAEEKKMMSEYSPKASVRSKSAVASHVERSRSPMPFRGSMDEGFRFKYNWDRSKAIVLVIIAFIWIVGMYHNYASSATTGFAHSEADRAATHLTAVVESQERALATCRLKLATATSGVV
eukprot:TRINITY_DN1712_c0_g1_i1.p1 TRINITY_DN1712_c0_g1~~TRINITY_DN1712_c0_g1_i1.p1  ORF type:complete len:676 (+),score=141.96 TRINITY_DN1712_c0_g1_i1:44-2071(+)